MVDYFLRLMCINYLLFVSYFYIFFILSFLTQFPQFINMRICRIIQHYLSKSTLDWFIFFSLHRTRPPCHPSFFLFPSFILSLPPSLLLRPCPYIACRHPILDNPRREWIRGRSPDAVPEEEDARRGLRYEDWRSPRRLGDHSKGTLRCSLIVYPRQFIDLFSACSLCLCLQYVFAPECVKSWNLRVYQRVHWHVAHFVLIGASMSTLKHLMQGSPGNLKDFEDVLFMNAEMRETTMIIAVKIGRDEKNPVRRTHKSSLESK